MQLPLLTEITIIFGLSVLVLFTCYRLKVPAIVGFLLTGVLAGPHGLGLIKVIHEVEILAEFGVVLLLFTIGIEFSLKSLVQIRKTVLLGGSVQVLLTILITYLIVGQLGQPFGKALFIGFLVSISSTVIMLKILQEKAEVDSPHGRSALGISIFQDVSCVLMMLIAPILAGKGGDVGQSLLYLLGKGILVIVLVIGSAKWVVPRILYQITRTRSRELFLISIVVICFAVAWLTSSIGLSLALGAFLAGLIISESEYSQQALNNIVPFRDVFTSFFFISIGMLLDIQFLWKEIWLVSLLTFGVLFIKTMTGAIATMTLGFPLRTTILTGLLISQVGEFSFVLSRTGIEYGLLGGNVYQMFLSVSVLTMAISPFLMIVAPKIADYSLKLPLPSTLKTGFDPLKGLKIQDRLDLLKDHLIIIGFGVNGRNLARAARISGIPYVIIEMNAETVRNERANGEPIYYGDAVQEAVLEHACINDSRVMVIAISDPAATRQITAIAKSLNPKLYIIARTRFFPEIKPLYDLGASEVIPEEFETSIEIFTRVLTKYLVPRDEIERFITEIRSDGYEMFRSLSTTLPSLSDLTLNIPNVEIYSFRINEDSKIVGKSLAEIELRNKYGVTLLAIQRGSGVLTNPDGETRLRSNDVVILLGDGEKVNEVAPLFS